MAVAMAHDVCREKASGQDMRSLWLSIDTQSEPRINVMWAMISSTRRRQDRRARKRHPARRQLVLEDRNARQRGRSAARRGDLRADKNNRAEGGNPCAKC